MPKTIAKLSDLAHDKRNANRGTKRGAAALDNSIAELGAGRSILADKDGNVIAGNKTLAAFRRSGGKKIRVVQTDGKELVIVQRTDLNLELDVKAKELAIADNRVGELSLEWDPAVLEELGKEIDLAGMFDPAELAALMLDPKAALLGDPDDVPDTPANPVTRRGELIRLGNHRLLCGDSTSAKDVAKLMDGTPAALCWMDPPYNVAYEGKTKDALKIENDSMSDEQFDAFLANAHKNAYDVLMPGGACYVAHADWFGHSLRMAYIESGLLLKQVLVWVKSAFALGRQDYQWQHEPILYGWKPGAAHRWFTDRKQTTVLNFDKPSRNAEHPTMKPVALVEYCLTNSSAAGEIVLDLFGGSGTTLIACEGLGRRARLMELDPRYCDVIVTRWERLTGRKAIRE